VPPPPPPPPASGSPTQIAGQQSAPATAVPHTPGLTGYTPSATQTNSLAVVSLVTATGSFFAHIIPGIGGLTVAVIAIVTGFMARNQIKQTGEQGKWMANVGIVIGIVHIVGLILLLFLLLFLIFVVGIALFGIAAHGGGTLPSPVPSG
jgi:hypothetical protein